MEGVMIYIILSVPLFLKLLNQRKLLNLLFIIKRLNALTNLLLSIKTKALIPVFYWDF